MGEMITIPIEEYRALQEAAEDLADIRASERVKADVKRGDDEYVPSDLVNRILAGESPVRVWREYRGLTQLALSEAAKVNRPLIAQIEGKQKIGSVDTLRSLANALEVPLDDLAPQDELGVKVHFQNGAPDWFEEELGRQDWLKGFSPNGNTYCILASHLNGRLPEGIVDVIRRAGGTTELITGRN